MPASLARRCRYALYLALYAGSISSAQDNSLIVDTPAVTSRTALNEIIVQLAPGISAASFAQQQGLSINYSFQSDPRTFVFQPTTTTSITPWLTTLAGDNRVQYLSQNYQTAYSKLSFTPNDPLYLSTGGFNGQWYINNSNGYNSANISSQYAWKNNFPGQGVIIGDVDDGIDSSHVDIAANFNATHTFDFIANTAVQVFNNNDKHGMSTSGIIAAVGGNGIGVTGVAPFASIASMKVFTGSTTGTDAQFRDAVLYHSSGSDTSVKIKNQSYGIPAPFEDDSIHNGGITISAAAGTIHVLSAGNERTTSGQDSNKKMAQANPNVITVAALGFNGTFASYSSYGANVFVTALSNNTSGASPGNGITTTDRPGNLGYNTNGTGATNYADRDYTNNFGGTSAAAPLVSGIMALGMQANPNLDVRLAKHLLARTSTIVNNGDVTASSDGGWRTNAAGFKFNQNYGFGMVNANEFVRMATQYVVTEQTIANSGTQNVNATITDGQAAGITRTYTNTVAGPLEEVVVHLDITHGNRGQLTAFLTNPSGLYTSRLFVTSTSDTAANIIWDFTDNAFWGEEALGTWSLNVRDLTTGTVGTWNSFSISFLMGTATAIPEPATMALLGLTLAGGAGCWWYRRTKLRAGLDKVVG